VTRKEIRLVHRAELLTQSRQRTVARRELWPPDRLPLAKPSRCPQTETPSNQSFGFRPWLSGVSIGQKRPLKTRFSSHGSVSFAYTETRQVRYGELRHTRWLGDVSA